MKAIKKKTSLEEIDNLINFYSTLESNESKMFVRSLKCLKKRIEKERNELNNE